VRLLRCPVFRSRSQNAVMFADPIGVFVFLDSRAASQERAGFQYHTEPRIIWLALISELIDLRHGQSKAEATLHYRCRTQWIWKDNVCPRLLTRHCEAHSLRKCRSDCRWNFAVAQLALRRIASRVRQGGHDVPRTDVIRRFRRGWANFLNVYQPLADHWAIYENSESKPRLLERGP
jgi:hypothetical protein